MRIKDLAARARLAVTERSPDPAEHGLLRLSGGMNHDVFTPIDDATIVVKVFRAGDPGAPEREWSALVALGGSGIAPDPMHFDTADPAIVVMSRVFGSSLLSGSAASRACLENRCSAPDRASSCSVVAAADVFTGVREALATSRSMRGRPMAVRRASKAQARRTLSVLNL